MQTSDNSSSPESRFLVVLMVSLAMIAAVPLYGVVAFFSDASASGVKEQPPALLRTIFYALIPLFMGIALFGKGFIKHLIEKSYEKSNPSVEILPEMRKFQQDFTAHIVTFAFCEALSIFGLVLFFIGGSWVDFLVFAGVSLVLMAINFPKRDNFI